MTDLRIAPQSSPLRGSVPVPSDKSITHRALLFAAIAEGRSVIWASKMGEDNRATLAALRALGVAAEEETDRITLSGGGLYGLSEPAGELDCGNSGTTMRLLAGLLAAQRFRSVLVGDASLSRRPMGRIAKPLRLRGARIEGRADPRKIGEITAPLEVGPLPAPHVLSGISVDLPIPSAQVKSALLLSGLYSEGPTVVAEPTISRDHTERMLSALGVPLERVGPVVSLGSGHWDGKLEAFELRSPGDLSAAAFVAVAAALVPESEVEIRDVGMNPTRTGFVDGLRAMGGAIELVPEGTRLGEPVGRVRAAHHPLLATTIAGELVARSIDEIPILCALAARAQGVTRVHDAAELRVKESDRIAAMVRVLRAFGVECEERPDGLTIEGRPEAPLRAADVDSEGDHRIAMTSAILGLLGDGPSRVRNADPIATSFPRFVGTLRALGARVEVC